MDRNKFNLDKSKNNEAGELSIIDIFDFFAKNVPILLIFVLAGIVASFALYWYIPQKWRADITIQVGKVPLLDRLDYITSPPEVAENIKSPLFMSKIVSAIYGSNIPADSPSARLVYDDLEASLIKGTDLVKIQVYGWSGPEAYRNATIVADHVILQQREISEPYLLATQKQLEQIVAGLQRDRDVLANVNTIDKESPARTETNALLKLALMDAKKSEIQKLQMEQTRLTMLLSMAKLHSPQVTGRSLVPHIPASPPKLSLFMLAGACLGFLFGVVFAVGRIVRERGLRNMLSSI